jgi:hypothetical protein
MSTNQSKPISDPKNEKYISPFGFNFGDPNAIKKAYGVLSRLVSPPKTHGTIYMGNGAGNCINNVNNVNINNGNQNCIPNGSNMNCEQTSRGGTTPY